MPRHDRHGEVAGRLGERQLCDVAGALEVRQAAAQRVELRRGGKSYTVITLETLRRRYGPSRPLVLILGADAFFGPNVIGAWKAALTGKTKLVGSVDGGWPKAALSEVLHPQPGTGELALVLPLLETVTVGPGLVDHDTFLAGYGAAQAMPGPLFTFASFLGASAQGVHWLWGAALATVAIFLPAALLVTATTTATSSARMPAT